MVTLHLNMVSVTEDLIFFHLINWFEFKLKYTCAAAILDYITQLIKCLFNRILINKKFILYIWDYIWQGLKFQDDVQHIFVVK